MHAINGHTILAINYSLFGQFRYFLHGRWSGDHYKYPKLSKARFNRVYRDIAKFAVYREISQNLPYCEIFCLLQKSLKTRFSATNLEFILFHCKSRFISIFTIYVWCLTKRHYFLSNGIIWSNGTYLTKRYWFYQTVLILPNGTKYLTKLYSFNQTVLPGAMRSNHTHLY